MNDEIWASTDCAEYLKYSRKAFMTKIRYLDGFPCPLPWSEEGQPRWAADEVREWALRRHYAKSPESPVFARA